MLYSVTLRTPDPYESYYNSSKRHVVGSLKEARMLAKDWLPVDYDSHYGARRTRRPFVKIMRCVRWTHRGPGKGLKEYTDIGRYVDTIETQVIIVPSVGELGYSP